MRRGELGLSTTKYRTRFAASLRKWVQSPIQLGICAETREFDRVQFELSQARQQKNPGFAHSGDRLNESQSVSNDILALLLGDVHNIGDVDQTNWFSRMIDHG